MKKVFIINGYPRSGKDTFVNILNKYRKTYRYSSIDRVKELAREFGWDGVKDEKGRKLLADLKKALVEYGDLPLQYMIEEYDCWLINSRFEFFCLFIREQEEIEKAKKLFNAETIFIENNRIQNIISNNADKNITTSGYDYYISNNGTLEDFEKEIARFVEEIKDLENPTRLCLSCCC